MILVTDRKRWPSNRLVPKEGTSNLAWWHFMEMVKSIKGARQDTGFRGRCQAARGFCKNKPTCLTFRWNLLYSKCDSFSVPKHHTEKKCILSIQLLQKRWNCLKSIIYDHYPSKKKLHEGPRESRPCSCTEDSLIPSLHFVRQMDWLIFFKCGSKARESDAESTNNWRFTGGKPWRSLWCGRYLCHAW
jgi:hypothetical protein